MTKLRIAIATFFMLACVLVLPVMAQDTTTNTTAPSAAEADTGLSWWWIIVPLLAIALYMGFRRGTDNSTRSPMAGAKGGRTDDDN